MPLPSVCYIKYDDEHSPFVAGENTNDFLKIRRTTHSEVKFSLWMIGCCGAYCKSCREFQKTCKG